MKTRRIITFVLLGLIALLIVLSMAAGFITDFWWFDSLGFAGVFQTSYETRYGLWLASFVLFLAAMYGTLRTGLASVPSIPADPRFANLFEALGKFARVALYGGAVICGFMTSGYIAGHWMDALAAAQAEYFGIADPIFGNDVGYYVFTLPFLDVVKNWLLATVVLAFIGTLLVYLVRQGVSFAFGRVAASPRARVHLASILAVFFVLLAFHSWLGRYDVLYSTRSGSFFGAGYTDVNAQLPAAWIVIVLTLAAGGLLVQALIKGAYKRLAQVFGGYVAIAILATGVFPAVIQGIVVNPNEQIKELEYIRNNITFTRVAFGLDRIEERTMKPTMNLTASDLAADTATLRNIVLWDYRPLASTLDQLQVIRLYYDFPDVDVDRYRLPDGSYRQVMLGARELNQDKLPANARTWVNQKLVYTHGYGIGMSPVNVVTDEGLPEFFVKDIPPTSSVGLEIRRPEIYFGEETRTPVVVKGNIDEFDYPVGDQNRMTRYLEQTGVDMGSFFRRLMFALHFADFNLLISGYIGPESRMVYHRAIQDRVSKIAPFLSYDGDPYLVVGDGRLVWMYDAYTTTDAFPYSRPVGNISYIRNSVKITIDAYNGETQFYSFGIDTDPIIRVYARIFPGLFKPIDAMPASLQKHVRYPQDLFDMQAEVYSTYHMEDPTVFYNKEDLWNIANEKLQEEVQKMESYSVVMRLPGEPREEYIQMVPYTPNRRDNMIAWLCARSDGANYGRMLVFKFPKQELTYGPMQVTARIDQDPIISSQLTLWNQQGSSVTRGNLLVFPIKEDVMYVQPVYLQATSGKLPELKRVIVSYGNRISMEPTLEEALRRVFGGNAALSTPAPRSSPAAAITSPTANTSPLNVSQLSKSALERYERAVKYQREGNWSKYGEELELLKQDLKKLVEQSAK
ncbi:MAG: UPF0182 family protein [Ignavibacteriae bacterium]|nr:UPF0182 family protein [Ignavibacteriota bacterium]